MCHDRRVRGNAIVVGAGIGGLTAAVALERCGWAVRVLERSPGPRTTGAGIVLLANALRGLDAIGVADAVRSVGTRAYPGSMQDERGRRLVHVAPEQIEARLGMAAVVLGRAHLQRALHQALHTEVEHGALVETVDAAGDRPSVGLADGSRHEADLVVAADGVRSRLRPQVVPGAPSPRYTGSTAWVAVIDNPGIDHMSQTWGPGGEFGTLPMADGRLYWYATSVGPEGRATGDPVADLADARRTFAPWHHPIPTVLDATRPDDVVRFDLVALPRPLRALAVGGVGLVGDAAHAMPPNIGQGGCQAIEDGVVLADSVTRAGSVADGLAVYDRVRRPRTASALRAAWATARVGEQLRNPALVAVRNAALRALPSRMLLDGMARFSRWRPPELPVSAR